MRNDLVFRKEFMNENRFKNTKSIWVIYHFEKRKVANAKKTQNRGDFFLKLDEMVNIYYTDYS